MRIPLTPFFKKFKQFLKFSITADIQYYISFGCTTQWLDLYNLLSDHSYKPSTHLTRYIIIIDYIP